MNFTNLPLLTALTFGERISMGLQVLVFGMAVIFSVLILLWGILELFRIIFYEIPKKKAAQNEPKPVEKAPDPVAPAPVVEITEPETSDEEIVAAITAALSVVMDKPQTSFRVVSFRRTASK